MTNLGISFGISMSHDCKGPVRHSSSGNSACHQAGQSEFNPWDPHGRKRKQTLTSVSLAPTHPETNTQNV